MLLFSLHPYDPRLIFFILTSIDDRMRILGNIPPQRGEAPITGNISFLRAYIRRYPLGSLYF